MLIWEAEAPKVSPGFTPRPSLSGDWRIAADGSVKCRRGSRPGLR